jgi:enoyl-CoA hydratase/carnithine racemase
MDVRVVHDDGVAQLILDHPPVNSFDAAFLRAVNDAVAALPDHALALVVGSAVDGIFAAGGDIPWMAHAPMEELLPFVALCQETYSAFERLEIPTIAAIDGACLGGGLELCLSCDIRVASEGAVLGLPEATIGLIAGAGMGIVSRVVPGGEALPAALDIARRLADGPAAAIRATKRLAVAAPDLSMADGLAREREEWEQVRRSPSSQEGLEAFAEKRRPQFRGLR